MDTSELIHVLLVEDNDDDAYLIGEALGGQFQLSRLNHGQQAYQHLTTTPTPPDVILLDYRLPEMNGIEIIQALQAQGKTLAYIMLTVDLQVETAIAAMKAGALDFLPKATGYDGLPEMIRKVDRMQRDRVEKQRMTVMLQEREQQLQELNANKDKFFSILAHDLKSPMAGFLSFADMIERDFEGLTEQERPFVIQQFRIAAETLFALLENLLTWSRLQRGLVECVRQTFALADLVRRSVALFTPNAAQKQITINTTVPPLEVSADLEMLDTIVRNLLSNAIKFTPSGGTVTVTAAQAANVVTLTVADTGVGMPPKTIAGLFRIDNKTKHLGTAGEKGTGLGLILCKEFIEKQGGAIGVDSVAGQGTTVTVTLPAQAGA